MWLVCAMALPILHHQCITWFSQILLKTGLIDLDLQGYLVRSTLKTAFNVAFVHWSKLTEGCYTSQTCSCLICRHTKDIFSVRQNQVLLNILSMEGLRRIGIDVCLAIFCTQYNVWVTVSHIILIIKTGQIIICFALLAQNNSFWAVTERL